MKYNTKTITVSTIARSNEYDTRKRAEALAILLGEYNKYGRSIDVIKYEEIRHRFENCISEIENELIEQ